MLTLFGKSNLDQTMNSAEFLARREALGWSQNACANALGLSTRQVQRYEAGGHSIPSGTAAVMRAACHDARGVDAVDPDIRWRSEIDGDMEEFNYLVQLVDELDDELDGAEWSVALDGVEVARGHGLESLSAHALDAARSALSWCQQVYQPVAIEQGWDAGAIESGDAERMSDAYQNAELPMWQDLALTYNNRELPFRVTRAALALRVATMVAQGRGIGAISVLNDARNVEVFWGSNRWADIELARALAETSID